MKVLGALLLISNLPCKVSFKRKCFKMSFQANSSSGMGESSDNAINHFHLPILINDPNGNEIPCSTGISHETIHVTTSLANGNRVSPDMQILSFNIGDVKKTFADQAACRLQGTDRSELEMAGNCDHEASDMVITNSLSSSDYQCVTANLSWHSKSSATSRHPGQCVLNHKQNYTVKSQLLCIKPSIECHATDIEQKLKTCVTNEAHLKTLENNVSSDSLKSGITDEPNDTVIQITTNMERSLEYSILPECKFVMKGNSVGSIEHESSVPGLESSVFSNSSNHPIVMSDQSLEALESPGEGEIMDDAQISYQLPVETSFNSQECAVRVSNQQPVLDKAEKIVFQRELSNHSTRLSQFPTFDTNQNLREQVGHCGICSVSISHNCKDQLEETIDAQLPVKSEQCYQDTSNTRMGEAEAYKMPVSSAMNTTFIVLTEVNNDSKPESKIISWSAETQELVPQAGTPIERNANDETFLISSPTVHECGNSYTQTSTPLPESRKNTFFNAKFPNLTDLPDRESCSTSLVESPIHFVLQPDGRDPVQKPGFNIKSNANMKAKLSKVEIKSYPKPNFNNVKPKVVSRTLKMSLLPKSNVSLSAERSSKYFPRSVTSISSLESPHSPSPLPKHTKKEPLSKLALKPKSEILKFQKVVVRKTPPTNEQSTSGMTEKKISKSSRNNSPQTRASSTSVFANGAESQVSGSLHFKSSHSSVGSITCQLHKTFHYDGTEKTNPSRQMVPVVEKPRARCSSLAGVIDGHLVSFNCPISAATLENVHTTEAPLTNKSSAPSISEVQVGQRPSLGNTKSLSAQSAKLKVLSSVPKTRLGSVNKDGRSGIMHCSTNKQPLISDQQKGISIKAKPRLAFIKATSNLEDNTVKSAPNSKLPVSASRLQRVNSLSSVSSGVSVQSVRSICSNKSAVTSTNRGGDCSRKAVLSASSSSNQTPCTKSLQKDKFSVKTPCREKGLIRNVTSTPSQNLPGSASRSARQVSTSHKLKADRTWVKSNSSAHKSSSRTARTPPDPLPVVKKAPGLPHYRAKCEKQVQWIALLKELLEKSNQRFEAVAIVVQYIQAQREVVGQRHKELSQELLTLRSELETRSVTCVQLEKDREELQNKYEGVIEKLSEEHQTELKGLEERLEELFIAEKEHLRQSFKNDVEKLQAQLKNEVQGLTSQNEAHKQELIAAHSNNLESLQKECQNSLTDLARSHELEMKTLEESFKERRSLLQDQIAELNEENDSLKKVIKTKEQVTKIQGQKDQKIDPLSLYLEQELESLKAVLEIKNEKIHNQEKKLMQMEKLMEKHTVLDEKLKIVLQENEDLKARMDKHIAVSRQLSTEQVVLQESLQKESKVNKRLSMENEELMWKLQNGDILGPKKLSPTSSLSFQPSKNSVSSSSSPAPSPR
ncbi:microtubule-associated tumor suppressor 1 homolog [Heterodontus francisci]|uniref:microtubule-associated tumor suppressor 1 homolog n=1 Tax=Heterodontus francisci TaxID=7792 RepID=UPI00355C4601